MTDIAWSADYSTMYGVAANGSNYYRMASFNPDTGVGSFVGARQQIFGSTSNIINTLG